MFADLYDEMAELDAAIGVVVVKAEDAAAEIAGGAALDRAYRVLENEQRQVFRRLDLERMQWLDETIVEQQALFVNMDANIAKIVELLEDDPS